MWMVFWLVLFCSWSKGVSSVSDILFIWFARTYDTVAHSGDAISIRTRRQILLRVLGMLHCDESQMAKLVTRLSWRAFPEYLPMAKGNFAVEEVNEESAVDTNCLY